MSRRGYGQFCPVAKGAEIFAERWTPLILRELLCGSRRFNRLRKGLPRMSPSLLSKRLTELERAGVVERRGDEEAPEYHLTRAGEELRPVVEALGVWGKRWTRSELEREDLDPGLLLWDMRRRAVKEKLPARRVVARFELPEEPSRERLWWMVFDRPQVDLCLDDPGYPVDLRITAELEALTGVWLGDLDLAGCLKAGSVVLEGPAKLRRRFPEWLGLSLFAGVERQRG